MSKAPIISSFETKVAVLSHALFEVDCMSHKDFNWHDASQLWNTLSFEQKHEYEKQAERSLRIPLGLPDWLWL